LGMAKFRQMLPVTQVFVAIKYGRFLLELVEGGTRQLIRLRVALHPWLVIGFTRPVFVPQLNRHWRPTIGPQEFSGRLKFGSLMFYLVRRFPLQ
jgi:hypothetical protein